MSLGRSINGSNALVQIQRDGEEPVVVGYATGVTVQEVIALNRIDVLGRIESKDIEAIGRSVSGSIGLMRMVPIGDDLFPGGGAANAGVLPVHPAGSDPTNDADATARTRTVMQFMEVGFDLVIKDSANFEEAGGEATAPGVGGTTRYVIKGCRPSSHSFSLSRGTLMGVNVTFEAIAITEEDAVQPS